MPCEPNNNPLYPWLKRPLFASACWAAHKQSSKLTFASQLGLNRDCSCSGLAYSRNIYNFTNYWFIHFLMGFPQWPCLCLSNPHVTRGTGLHYNTSCFVEAEHHSSHSEFTAVVFIVITSGCVSKLICLHKKEMLHTVAREAELIERMLTLQTSLIEMSDVTVNLILP